MYSNINEERINKLKSKHNIKYIINFVLISMSGFRPQLQHNTNNIKFYYMKQANNLEGSGSEEDTSDSDGSDEQDDSDEEDDEDDLLPVEKAAKKLKKRTQKEE